MSYTSKQLEDLDIMDDFLTNVLATDPQIGELFCRLLVSQLLQREVGRIRVKNQRNIVPFAPDKRGIRLDIEVEEYDDDSKAFPIMNVYDVEPHKRSEGRSHLVRRNRFYQAKIDSLNVESGEKNLSRLPNLYVINILNYDPFGYNYMLYTVENRCKEVDELEYGDGLQFLYFYTGGEKGGSAELRQLLRFIENSTAENATNETTRKLLEYVQVVKTDPEVRMMYMTVGEIMDMVKEEGREEGREESRLGQIDMILEWLGRFHEVPDEVRSGLMNTKEESALKRLAFEAARAASMEEFLEKVGL